MSPRKLRAHRINTDSGAKLRVYFVEILLCICFNLIIVLMPSYDELFIMGGHDTFTIDFSQNEDFAVI